MDGWSSEELSEGVHRCESKSVSARVSMQRVRKQVSECVREWGGGSESNENSPQVNESVRER